MPGKNLKTSHWGFRISPKVRDLIKIAAFMEGKSQTAFFFKVFELGIQQMNKKKDKNRRIMSKILK